jgi:hypothetical protein
MSSVTQYNYLNAEKIIVDESIGIEFGNCFVMHAPIEGNGSNPFIISTFQNNTPQLKIDNVSGDLTVRGDLINFGTMSDIRLKKDIKKIDDALNRVLQLNGYTFEYADDTSEAKHKGRMMGLIAQEVIQVAPELVYTQTNSEYYALRYQNAVPLLLEAIKELSLRVEYLESQLKI